MRMFTFLLAAALGLSLTANTARAGYELRFADSTGTETTSFDLVFPSKLDVQVYLVATGSDAAGFDLSRYGVQLNYSGSANAKVLATSDITNNAAFNGLDAKAIENDGGATDWARSRDTAFGPAVGGVANPNEAGTNRILLATFSFTGLSNGDSITFSADPTGTNDTRLGDGTLIDSLIVGQSAVITVTAVPEPGSLLLGGLLATGFGGFVVRRRKRAAVQAA